MYFFQIILSFNKSSTGWYFTAPSPFSERKRKRSRRDRLHLRFFYGNWHQIRNILPFETYTFAILLTIYRKGEERDVNFGTKSKPRSFTTYNRTTQVVDFLHTNKWFFWSSSVEFWTISPKPLTVNRTKHQRTCCCFLFLQRFCAFSCAFCWIWPTSGDWSPHLRRAWETKIASRIIFEYGMGGV